MYAYDDSTSKTMCLEVTISKKKWCVTLVYFFKELNKSLSNIARKCENVLVARVLRARLHETRSELKPL